jgi:hypothetical protein
MDEKWIAQIWMRQGVYEPAMRDELRRLQLELFTESIDRKNEAAAAAEVEEEVCSK